LATNHAPDRPSRLPGASALEHKEDVVAPLDAAARTEGGESRHLTWTLFGLAILVTLANLGDFTVGRSGDRQIRARLYDFYFAIEGDWKSAFQIPAHVVSAYLDRIFGRWPFPAILRVAPASLVMTLILYVPALFRTDSVKTDIFSDLILTLPPLYFGDLLSWGVSAFVMRRLAHASAGMAAASITVLLGAAAFASTSVLVLWTFLLLLVGTLQESYAGTGGVVSLYTLETFPILCLLPAIPLILLTGVVLLGVAAYLLRGLIRPPLLFLLERVDASNKPVLTLLAAATAGIAALIAVSPKIF
jgi:hypothetical protein